MITVTSMLDVFSAFGEHSVIMPKARAWLGAYTRWAGHEGSAEDVQVARDDCLNAVETAFSFTGVDTRAARERKLADERLPKLPAPLPHAADEERGTWLERTALAA
jgi:hypothetical protein